MSLYSKPQGHKQPTVVSAVCANTTTEIEDLAEHIRSIFAQSVVGTSSVVEVRDELEVYDGMNKVKGSDSRVPWESNFDTTIPGLPWINSRDRMAPWFKKAAACQFLPEGS